MTGTDDSDPWRAELLRRVGRVMLLATPLVYLGTRTTRPLVILAYALLMLSGAAAAFTSRAGYRLTGLLTVFSLLFMGGVAVRVSGPSPSGVLCLVLGTVLATVVFGHRAGLAAIAGSAAAFLVLGLAFRFESAPLWAPALTQPTTWYRMTTNYLVLSALLIVLVSAAMRRVEGSLVEARSALGEAVRERQARREAEGALRENEERLRLALDAAGMGTWEWDVPRDVVSSTGRARSLHDVPPELPDAPDTLWQAIHPEDVGILQGAIQRALAGPASEFRVEYRVKSPDPPRWLEGRGKLYRDAAGAPILMRGTVADITARKQAEAADREHEAELAALFAAMNDVILVLDAEGRYLRVAPTNPSLLYRPSEELIGRRLHDVFPPDRADVFLAQITRALATRRAVQFEYSLTIKGSPVRFSASVSPLPGDSVVWVARDVTEHLRLEAELRRQETLAAMGSLVAGVAHEVRTPLFSVSATVDVLERGASSAQEERELKDLLRSQVQRLSNLMQDLLDYGSPPRLRLERRPLADPVRRAAAMCEGLAADAGVSLRLEAPEGLRELDLDMVRLEQVFQNLIANAVQHSPRSGTVRISLRQVEVPQPGVACLVEDDGTGIAPPDLERVFEPFFSRRKGGTGLGLSIAQRLVESHGGILTAANQPGRGAAFTVFLPQTSSERESVRA